MSIFNTPFNQNFHSTKVTTIMLIWCLKHVKDFIFTFSMIQQVEVFFFRKTIFGFVYHDTYDSFPLG